MRQWIMLVALLFVHTMQVTAQQEKKTGEMQGMPGMQDLKMPEMDMGENPLIAMHPETFRQVIVRHDASGTGGDAAKAICKGQPGCTRAIASGAGQIADRDQGEARQLDRRLCRWAHRYKTLSSASERCRSRVFKRRGGSHGQRGRRRNLRQRNVHWTRGGTRGSSRDSI